MSSGFANRHPDHRNLRRGFSNLIPESKTKWNDLTVAQWRYENAEHGLNNQSMRDSDTDRTALTSACI